MTRLISAFAGGVLSLLLFSGTVGTESSKPAALTAPGDLELGPIVLNYRSHTASLPVTSVFVLPGEPVDVEVLGSRNGDLQLDIGGGQVEMRSDRSFRWFAPAAPGLYPLEIHRTSDARSAVLNAFVMVPAAELRSGALNGYRIGNYPYPRTSPSLYDEPRGFIEVTPELEQALVSPHFKLGQFLCKQSGGFPKYLVLREQLVLKLEHLLAKVNENGIAAESFHVMSGFRTPSYNEAIGNVPFSRHVWGGAADIFVDEDRNGVMDDLNADGRVDASDAQVLYDIIDVEDRERSPQLAGGLGKYNANAAHGPFVHVDVRGTTARW